MDDEREAKKPRRETQPATLTQRTGKCQKTSASTWRLAELENCSVGIKRDVLPKDMIPEKFFNFAHLEKFEDCLDLSFVMSLTWLGKKDMCRLSSEEAQKLDLINESSVYCRLVFHAFSWMFQAQPLLRELALSRKRAQHKPSWNVVSQSSSIGTLCSCK